MSWSDFEHRLGICAGQAIKLADGGAAAALDAADRLAKSFQVKLFARQQFTLWVTLVCIMLLVVFACITSNPLFTLFGPVAVFVMILRFDAIRQSAPVFRFAALRLAAETLRVLTALEGKPELRHWVLTQRLHSAHAVADLAKAATTALSDAVQVKAQESTNVLLKLPLTAQTPSDSVSEDVWSTWREGQSDYFSIASAREADRSRIARWGFWGAFTIVALIGFALGIWILIDPQATVYPFYGQSLAAASGSGAIGLAWITLARERKCFEQSIDYGHMHELFARAPGGVQDGLLVCEAVAEHTRWAIRMAGHFRVQPH